MRQRDGMLSIEEVIRLYTVAHLTCEEIGKKYGVTRQAVAGRLKKAGVKSGQGERVAIQCDHCKAAISVTRKRWRTNMKNFCNGHCYYASLERGYWASRQGCRRARAVVAKFLRLEKDYIVHHEDRDQRNNQVENLRVFADQAAHMAYHRGRRVVPLWDGSKVARETVTVETVAAEFGVAAVGGGAGEGSAA